MIHASPRPDCDFGRYARRPARSVPAYDIKPKTPDSAFAGKLLPDILGISAETTAGSARAIFEASYKARSDGKNDIQQQKFGGTNVSYISALMFSAPAGAKNRRSAVGDFLALPAPTARISSRAT